MAEDLNPPPELPRDGGYLRACDGVLRCQFGRRAFGVAARTMEILARDVAGAGAEPVSPQPRAGGAVRAW